MNTANRVLWICVSLVLLAIGVLGILASQGWLDGVDTGTAVLPNSLNARWRDAGFWAPTLAIVVGLVLVALGVLLLWAQFRRRGGSTMPDLDLPDGHGHTRVASRTLVRALSTDLSGDRDIQDAWVRLTGTPDQPRLLLRLLVAPGADLSRVRRYVDTALTRFSTTSGIDPQVADVEVRMSGGAVGRVA
ncbi:MAG TPA: hypothetical protein VF163_10305 [Micromonosporaceae bacterium]